MCSRGWVLSGCRSSVVWDLSDNADFVRTVMLPIIVIPVIQSEVGRAGVSEGSQST
jgi:hypothetical protein